MSGRTFHALLEHHAKRVRENPNNLYAAGALDTLIELAAPYNEHERIYTGLVNGKVVPTDVPDPTA